MQINNQIFFLNTVRYKLTDMNWSRVITVNGLE